MKSEETVYENENTQYEETQFNEDINEEVTNQEEVNDEEDTEEETEPKKESTLKNAAKGMGMGILLGSVASFLSGSAIVDSNDPDTPTPQPNNGGGAVSGDQPEWTDGNVGVATTVNDDMSFSQAFAAARAEVGPGGAFEWRGNVYSTYYAEEWESLTPEERQEFNEHFIWSNHDSSESQTTQATEEVEVVSTEPTNATQAAVVEDNYEPEVEILGVVHDDASGANVGVMTVDNQEVILIDVDNSGSFDYMASDLNNDGQFTQNELADISDQNITVDQFESAVANDALYASTDGTPDYVNDAPDFYEA